MDLFTSSSPVSMDAAARRRLLARRGAGTLVTTLPAQALAVQDGYSLDAALRAASAYFGPATEGLAHVVHKAFRDHGQPTGFIRGQEHGAGPGDGMRHGEGVITLKSGLQGRVYWSGPAIGFDAGERMSKVFALVYHLEGMHAIYQRFPGGDAGLYYVGGADIHYDRLDGLPRHDARVATH